MGDRGLRPTPDGHRAKEARGQRYERARRPVHTDDTAWRAADERVAALGHTSSLSYLFGENKQADKVEKTDERKLVTSESGSVFDLGAMFRSASEAVGLGAVDEVPEDDGEEEEVYDPQATPSAVTEDAVPYWQTFDDPPPEPDATEEDVEAGKKDESTIFGFSLFGGEGELGVGGDKEEEFSLAPRFANPDEARAHVLGKDEAQPEFDEAGAARVKPALHDEPSVGLEALVMHGLKYGVGQRLDHLDALDDQIAGIFAEPVVEATVLTPEEIRARHPSLVAPLAGTEYELHPTQEEKDAARAAVVAEAREKGKEPPPDDDDLPADVPLRPAPERHLIHRPSKYEGLMAGLDRDGGSYAAGQAAKTEGGDEVAHGKKEPEEGAEQAARRPSQTARAKHETRGGVAPGRVPLAASLSRAALEAIAEHQSQEIVVDESPKPEPIAEEAAPAPRPATAAASVFAPVSTEGAIGFEEAKNDDVVMAPAPAPSPEKVKKTRKKKKTREASGEEKETSSEDKPKRKKKSKSEKEPGETKKKKKKPREKKTTDDASPAKSDAAPPAPAPALRGSSSMAQDAPPPKGKDDGDCTIM